MTGKSGGAALDTSILEHTSKAPPFRCARRMGHGNHEGRVGHQPTSLCNQGWGKSEREGRKGAAKFAKGTANQVRYG